MRAILIIISLLIPLKVYGFQTILEDETISYPIRLTVSDSVRKRGGPGDLTNTRATGRWARDASAVWQYTGVDTNVIDYAGGSTPGLSVLGANRQNKVTAYNVIGADKYGTELAAGNLTKGKVYEITARDDQDFTADGAADNNVGTQFVATNTTVTLDAGDKVKEIGGTQLNSDGTDEGTFKTGLGAGATNYRTGGAWVNNALPGITGGGGEDDNSSITVVSDTAAIAAAGFQNLCTSGKVYYVDNTASAAGMYVLISGVTGNVNNHVFSAIARSTTNIGVSVYVNQSGGGQKAYIDSSTYAVRAETDTPTDAARTLALGILAGHDCYFFVPQLEEGNAVTSPKITQGSATTEAADDIRISELDKNFNQTEGMVCLTIVPEFDKGDVTDKLLIGTKIALAGNSHLFFSGVGSIMLTDGTSFPLWSNAYSAGDTLKICSGWSNAGMQVTANGSSGTATAYDGAFTTDANNAIFIGDGATEPFRVIGDVEIFDVERGQAWREAYTQ